MYWSALERHYQRRHVWGQSPGHGYSGRGRYSERMLDPMRQRTDVTLEPLDDYLVVQPLDETETPSGLIVPINEAAQCSSGIHAPRT